MTRLVASALLATFAVTACTNASGTSSTPEAPVGSTSEISSTSIGNSESAGPEGDSTTVTATTAAPATTTSGATIEQQPEIDVGAVPADPLAFEAAGIQVVDEISELTELRSPMVLERVQADRMLADVGPYSGVYGADIDALVQNPGVPLSFLIGAWVAIGESDAAATARGWMGEQDWSQTPTIRFPMAVLTLFVNDMATMIDAASTPDDETLQFDPVLPPGSDDVQPVNGFARVAAPALAGPCTAVQNFVSVAVASVINALHINPNPFNSPFIDGIVGPIIRIYNYAVDRAGDALRGLIAELTNPVFDLIRQGLATLAIATHIVSFFTDTSVTVNLAPPGNPSHFAVGSESDVTGIFVGRARSLTGEWPGVLIDCAQATGVKLPQPIGPGAEAHWTVAQPEPLVTTGPTDARVLDDLSLRLDFVTGRETEQQATGEALYPNVRATVTVPRRDAEELLRLGRQQAEAAKAILLSRIPTQFLRDQASGALSLILDPVLNQVQRELEAAATSAGWFNLSGSAAVTVIHHAPPTTTTTSSVPPQSGPTSNPPVDFCTQIRAMIQYMIETPDDVPTLAAEVVRRLEIARSAAPTELLGAVDNAANGYQLYADDAPANDIIEFAPTMDAGIRAITDYCGIDPLM